MGGKHANMKELARIAEYNRTHRVGVPNEGEKVCPRCKGNGQIDKRIPLGQFMGGQYQPCERCFGTGCVKSLANPNNGGDE